MLVRTARIGILVSMLTIASVAFAHPYHVSLAEVEYDEPAGTLEVALRVFPDDLELALRKRTGERVVLETSPDIESIVASYIKQEFVVRSSAEQSATLEWVGMELGVKEAWLYFVLRGVGDLNDASLTNRVMFAVRPSQMNTVLLSVGNETRTYLFTANQPTQKFVDAGQSPPIVLEVQRRHSALEVIVQNAGHLDSAERAAFELLGACASLLLLHPNEPDHEAEDQRLLDAALEMVSQAPDDEVGSADRVRLGIMSASAGHVRSAFNLLAEAVATSASKHDANTVLVEAVRAAAKVALRHADDELAKSWQQASEGASDQVLLALGEARAYIRAHDHK